MARLHLPRALRLLIYALLLGTITITGAQGQNVPKELRIGLYTKQPQLRLQGTQALCVEEAGTELLTTTPAQPLTFLPKDNGLAIQDAGGKELAICAGQVQIKLLPADTRMRDVANPLPAIKVLGPSKHYDGKPDRPYRGEMEILSGPQGLTLVNIVNVEDYLLGVVSSEMSPGYPVEALKAQAVAARTYALKNIGRFAAQGFDLDDTAASQVYGGIFNEDPRTTRAVTETAGTVLTYDGQLVDAVYSSTCGGYTESAEYAWGRAVPYLVGVTDFPEGVDPVVAQHPADEAGWGAYFKTARGLNCLQPKYAKPEAFRWVKLVTRKELEAGLPEQYRVGTIQQIIPLKRGASGRIFSLRVEGTERSVTIEKELPIRKAFGTLRSSAFVVDTYRDDNGVPVVFAFWGAGWGHGLGMCQVGAVGLADQGWSYDKILSHYYQGATLTRQ